jgi:hypothetical protein
VPRAPPLALASLGNGAGATARLRMRLAALGWSLMYGVGRARRLAPHGRRLELADQLDDRSTGCALGFVHRSIQQRQIARRRIRPSFVDGAANSTDPIDSMMADRLLATALHYLGDQKSARHHIERVLVHLADLTLKPRIVRFRFDLRVSAHYFQARILWLQGFADQALRAVERNIEEGRASGHALTFCSVLGQAACPTAFLAGDLDAAERYCAALLDHTERHPIRLWNLWARCFKGIVMVKRGDIAAGLEVLRSELGRAGGQVPATLPASAWRTRGVSRRGRRGRRALATVDEALVRCEARDERWYVAELLRIRGKLLLHETEHRSISAAEQCFGEALELARRQGALFWELRCALSLARLRIGQDRPGDARAVLAPAYEKFAEGFKIADLRHAGAMLEQLSVSLSFSAMSSSFTAAVIPNRSNPWLRAKRSNPSCREAKEWIAVASSSQ